MHCSLFASHFFAGQSLLVVVLNKLFFKKKWSLVALNRWSSYTVTNVWELAWADSALVVLDEWLSYRGDCLNMFDCNA